MNMKMEEHEEAREGTGSKRRRTKPARQSKRKNTEGDDLAGDAEESESVVSGDEAPSEYESMLQEYEAEVRNHIKIEQPSNQIKIKSNQIQIQIKCNQINIKSKQTQITS